MATNELSYGWALLRMLAALAVVCAVIFVVLRVGLRRLTQRRQGHNLKILERCPLTASRGLWIVQAGRRYFLVGDSEGSIAKLAELPAEELTLPDSSTAPRFADILKNKVFSK